MLRLFSFKTFAVVFLAVLVCAVSVTLHAISQIKTQFSQPSFLFSEQWRVGSFDLISQCFSNPASYSYKCVDEMTKTLKPIPSQRTLVPLPKGTRYFYTQTFDFPESMKLAIKKPTMTFGFFKGHARIYLNGLKIHETHSKQEYIAIPVDPSQLKSHQNSLLIISEVEHAYPGLYHFYDIGVAEWESVEAISSSRLDYNRLRSWLIVVIKLALIVMSLSLFLMSNKKTELVFLSLYIFSTSLQSLTNTPEVRDALTDTLFQKSRYYCFFLSLLFFGLYLLAYFRESRRLYRAYLTLSLPIGLVFGFKLFSSSDISSINNTLAQWVYIGFPLHAFVIIIYSCLRTVNLFKRYRLLYRAIPAAITTIVFIGSTYFLGDAYRVAFHPGTTRFLSIDSVDLLVVLSVAIIPFVEIFTTERRKEKMEREVSALVEKILSSTSHDYASHMQWILDQACHFFKARRGSLALRASDGHFYVGYVSGRTPPTAVGKRVESHSLADRLLQTGEDTYAVPNASYDGSFKSHIRQKNYQTRSFISTRLSFENNAFGLLVLSDPEPSRSFFTHLERPQIRLFGLKIASEIYKEKQAEELRAKNRELEQTIAEADRSLRVLSTTVDDHFHEEDEDTSGHNGAVVTFSEGILRAVLELGLKDKIEIGTFEKDIELNSLSFRQRLKRIAMMHDIGKREVPAAVLCKKDRLIYPDETQAMQGHALASYYILQGRKFEVRFNRAIELEKVQRERFGKTEHCRINYLDTEGKRRLQRLEPNYEKLTTQYPDEYDGIVAASHQEHWNGEGYPFALQGPQIPVIGRIMCLADSMAVMKLREVYEPPKSWEWVFFELERCAGTQFDPILVRAAQHYWLSRMPTAAKLNVQLAVQKGLAGKAAQDSGIFEKHSRKSRSAA